MKIQILIDNTDSWYYKYVDNLMVEIYNLKHETILLNNYNNIISGDILFILSCNNIIPDNILKLNKHNIVVHASQLPKGRGNSPISWKILEGCNHIFISLFEAVSKVDSGNIYLKKSIKFNGSELINEIRKSIAYKINDMILIYISNYKDMINWNGIKQTGKPSYYKKRTPIDSQLDINKTIKHQFNLLRIVDNNLYPAFFFYKGCKYILSIKKE